MQATRLPVAVLPVSMKQSISSMRAGPSSAPRPVTICRMPRGSPASSSSRAAQRVENGVCASGLTTTPLPAASAGMTSVMPRSSG